MHAGTMRGLTVGSESTGVAPAAKPRAKRPAAAKKAIVLSDSEDDASDGGLQLDDRWVAASQAAAGTVRGETDPYIRPSLAYQRGWI